MTEGRPWTYYVRPDTAEKNIPARVRPLVSDAPLWSEIRDRVGEMLRDWPLVFYVPTCYEVLRAHLPDRLSRRVLYGWNIAKDTWPQRYSTVQPHTATAQAEGMCDLITAILLHSAVILPPPMRPSVPPSLAARVAERTEPVPREQQHPLAAADNRPRRR